MRVRIAPKIVIRVSAILVLSASLSNALSAAGQGNRASVFVNQVTAPDVKDRPLSPRLAALQDLLKSGDRSALDSFWKDIAQHGAPLIEPAPDSDRETFVTMLWRA